MHLSSTLIHILSLSIFASVASALPQPKSSSLTSVKVAGRDVLEPRSSPSSAFIRGVNIGGWLILEKWLNPDVFTGAGANAVDQWTFDSTSGAQAALQNHWSTFFTQADVQSLQSTGINALRIPIGYWAYDNSNTPYIQGADAFLDQAIGWARSAGMKVWIDCHGSPGSQNGFDNSGREGAVEWQQGGNLDQSTAVLTKMAQKYGAQSYADTVIGLELVNEPISWGNNSFSVTQQWAANAYKAVRAAAANQDLIIVMHDAFQGANAWTSLPAQLGSNGLFAVDSHLYQCFVASDSTLTQQQHIQEACGWGPNLQSANAALPTFVGEWSPVTNICVNPDGSTTPGTSCSTSGCQCQSADFDSWNPQMVEQVRKYVEAQLDTFEKSTSGYFMWTLKGPGGWGFQNGIQKGLIPNPVTTRQYPGQCS